MATASSAASRTGQRISTQCSARLRRAIRVATRWCSATSASRTRRLMRKSKRSPGTLRSAASPKATALRCCLETASSSSTRFCLILGSGNVVHNLRHAFSAWHRGDTRTPDWARDFDAGIARALSGHDHDALAHALDGDAGRLAHPTPDHYLPLLYVAGASSSADVVRFPIEGFDMGSLSMRTAWLG